MSKRRFARFAAVMTTLVAAGALISTLVVGTGAYFTDSKPGAITGNLGTVVVATGGTAINFANLMPGDTQTQTVTVRNDGTGNEDIYLAFKNDNGAWSAANSLGQFGKFVINGETYDNLNNRYPALTPGVPGVEQSNFMPSWYPGCTTVHRLPANYLPHVIKLGTLTPNQTWTFTVAFTVNACMTDVANQGQHLWGDADTTEFSPAITPAPLEYSIAAFQPGIDPTDPFNGLAKIAPLVQYAGALPVNVGFYQ